MRKFSFFLIAYTLIINSISQGTEIIESTSATKFSGKADSLKDVLLSNSSSTLSTAAKDYSDTDFWNIIKTHNSFTKFGTNDDNITSFKEWVLTYRALYVLRTRNDPCAEEQMSSNKSNRQRRFEMADFYAKGNENYPQYLAGIWAQVALYDSEAKESFLTSCKEERLIPKNDILAGLVEFYYLP